MLDLPEFTEDEKVLVAGYGRRWLGGWWAFDDDEREEPSRGGVTTFGYLVVHHLPSHRVEQHELTMELPRGWLPPNWEEAIWDGARKIRPTRGGVELILPGGVPYQITAPLSPVIRLPTPDARGGGLL
jgi:hypothetical protein